MDLKAPVSAFLFISVLHASVFDINTQSVYTRDSKGESLHTILNATNMDIEVSETPETEQAQIRPDVDSDLARI
jgi:hypothetical protein